MSGADAAISPGSPWVRATVIRVDGANALMDVGDWFEVRGSRLVIPDGKAICPLAFAAVVPVIGMRQVDLPADNWLARKPYICSADAEENIVMRIDAVPVGARS